MRSTSENSSVVPLATDPATSAAIAPAPSTKAAVTRSASARRSVVSGGSGAAHAPQRAHHAVDVGLLEQAAGVAVAPALDDPAHAREEDGGGGDRLAPRDPELLLGDPSVEVLHLLVVRLPSLGQRPLDGLALQQRADQRALLGH